MNVIIRAGSPAHLPRSPNVRLQTVLKRLQELMASVDYNGQSAQSHSAAERAFCAAFFFLPISKALLFISLAIAFALFILSGRCADALRRWHRLPWMAPALILAALPVTSLALHEGRGAVLSHLGLSYYWLLAFGIFLASSVYTVRPWLRA